MGSVRTKGKSSNQRKTERLQRENKPSIGHNSGVPAPVVDTPFPKTIAAAQDIERSQWRLGDALVEECGPPSEPGEHTGSDAMLMEARLALKAAGCEYSFDYLRDIRRTAANFRNGERSPDGEALPFSYFLIAGTPENLRTVREKAKAVGEELTARFIRETLKEDEIDVAKWLTDLNEELENAREADKAFDKEKDGFSRLSELDRAKLFEACKLVEAKWTKIAARFQPASEQTTDTEKKKAAA
jgi:hypothetical protein